MQQDELHYPWGQEWTLAGTLEEERFAQLRHRDAETSFDPTQYRMYSSNTGRWQTPDPVRACPLHPQNFDRYAYVAGNPTNLVDPKGNIPLWLNPYSDYQGYYYNFPYDNPSGFGYDETGYLIALGLNPYYPSPFIGEIVLGELGVALCPECDILVGAGIAAYELYWAYQIYEQSKCEAQYQSDLKVCGGLSNPAARSRCYESALNRKNRCEQGWNPLPPLITW